MGKAIQRKRWDKTFEEIGKAKYDEPAIIRLYVDKGWSTPRIMRRIGATDPTTVRGILMRNGIELRSQQETKFIGSEICRVDGCGKPSRRIWHKKAQAWYGTLCWNHWKRRNSRWISAKRYGEEYADAHQMLLDVMEKAMGKKRRLKLDDGD